MNTYLVVSALFIAATLNGAAVAQTAVRTTVTATPIPIAQVSTIKARAESGNLQGKVRRFVDAGQREFEVKYTTQGRVESIQATKQRHVSDILSIGYDESGRIITVVLADGNILYYSYAADGSRQIRDRSSVQTGRSDKQPYLLADTVTRMDALMNALAQ